MPGLYHVDEEPRMDEYPSVPPVPRPRSVLIVADSAAVRASLRRLLERHWGLRLVGEAESWSGALACATRERPDVMLLALDLGEPGDLAPLLALFAAAPRARVLILTDVREHALLRSALHQGVTGAISQQDAPEMAAPWIQETLTPTAWSEPPTITAAPGQRLRVSELDPEDLEQARVATLTAHERQVIALVGEGLKDRQIARCLSLSEAAVRHALSSVFAKLGLSNRFELLIFAYHTQLVRRPR